MQIVTQAPGQAPEEVERSVTLPIEREMSGVPRMTQLRSVSITGLSVVTLTFADNTDDYFARQQVMEKSAERHLAAGPAARSCAADQCRRRGVSLCAGCAGRHVAQRGACIAGLGIAPRDAPGARCGRCGQLRRHGQGISGSHQSLPAAQIQCDHRPGVAGDQCEQQQYRRRRYAARRRGTGVAQHRDCSRAWRISRVSW